MASHLSCYPCRFAHVSRHHAKFLDRPLFRFANVSWPPAISPDRCLCRLAIISRHHDISPDPHLFRFANVSWHRAIFPNRHLFRCVKVHQRQHRDTETCVSARSGRDTEISVIRPGWPRYRHMCDMPGVAEIPRHPRYLCDCVWLEASVSVYAQSG